VSEEEVQSAEVQSAEEPVAEPVSVPEEPVVATPPVEAPSIAVPAEEEPAPEEPDLALEVATHLLDVDVRLWAELGRARLALGHAVALGTGAIVDLDKEPDDALDVFVNGRLFARGRLLLVDGEWAIRLDQIVDSPTAVEHASIAGSGA
jgi:flagellar motor switch protein FliN/FliY